MSSHQQSRATSHVANQATKMKGSSSSKGKGATSRRSTGTNSANSNNEEEEEEDGDDGDSASGVNSPKIQSKHNEFLFQSNGATDPKCYPIEDPTKFLSTGHTNNEDTKQLPTAASQADSTLSTKATRAKSSKQSFSDSTVASTKTIQDRQHQETQNETSRKKQGRSKLRPTISSRPKGNQGKREETAEITCSKFRLPKAIQLSTQDGQYRPKFTNNNEWHYYRSNHFLSPNRNTNRTGVRWNPTTSI